LNIYKDIYIYIMNMNRSKPSRYDNNTPDVYTKAKLSVKIQININSVGRDIKNKLERLIKSSKEGKCIPEGYVKPNTIRILTYSSGYVNECIISYIVLYTCDICLPVEGMLIDAQAVNITKAGIKAEVSNDDNTPMIIFLARDNHYNMPYFSTIKEKDNIKVRVIGQRFELNDINISVIAELIDPTKKAFVILPPPKSDDKPPPDDKPFAGRRDNRPAWMVKAREEPSTTTTTTTEAEEPSTTTTEAEEPSTTTEAEEPSTTTTKAEEPLNIKQFYSKSVDKKDLGSNIKSNWRKVLSNFYPSIIKLNIGDKERSYPTPEHAFQGAKYILSAEPINSKTPVDIEELATRFEIRGSYESPVDAKSAGGKSGFKKNNVKLTDYWDGQSDSIMLKILTYRYTHDDEFKDIIQSAIFMNVYLLHYERSGKKPSYWGGHIDKTTGEIVGTNTLGKMIMSLA
jgi:DNA-directed RNA polymerase subunit E'/Rpb7